MKTHVSTRSGCGCGSAGAISTSGEGCGGGCGCGGQVACREPAAYVRPRFFPGQLLTEDDLGQLADYTTAKNRLHNRFLFGDGVVCGLEVTCDPCGGGRVEVKSGYALDCCGNDIVVPCPVELDINQMVRDLLRSARGKDCGDPCPPPSEEIQAKPGAIAPAYGVPPAKPDPVQEPKGGRYCLYISYCEQPSDPVAPYTTDDPCGAEACQFSRVREGYRFELRCPDSHKEDDGFLMQIRECLDPFTKTDLSVTVLRILKQRSEALAEAIAAVKRAADVDQPSDTLKTLAANANSRWNAASDLFVRMLLVEEVASAVMKADLAAMGQTSAGAAVVAVPDSANELRRLVADWKSAITDDAQLNAKPEIERITIKETVTAAQFWTTPANRATGWDKLYAPRLLAGGFGLTERLFMLFRDATMEIQRRLVAASARVHTDCTLTPELQAVYIPLPVSKELREEDVAALKVAMETVSLAMERFIKDCLCLAILPKCAPCDDSGVLLACLTVRDCKVVDICNLERRFVLAPTTVRYWAGALIDEGGKLVEGFCCGSTEKATPTFGRRELRTSSIRFNELITTYTGGMPRIQTRSVGAGGPVTISVDVPATVLSALSRTGLRLGDSLQAESDIAAASEKDEADVGTTAETATLRRRPRKQPGGGA